MATMAKTRLQIVRLRIKENGETFPWVSTGDGDPGLVEVSKDDFASLYPFDDYQHCVKQEIEGLFQANQKDFEEQLAAVREIVQPRRLSILEEQFVKPVPITPHTNKIRRVHSRRKRSSSPAARNTRSTRSSVQPVAAISTDTDDASTQEKENKRPKKASNRKKPSVTRPKRSSRPSKPSMSTLVMPEIQEIPDADTAGDVSQQQEPVQKKKGKTVKMIAPLSNPSTPDPKAVDDVPRQNAETPKDNTSEIERDSLSTPEPMEGVNIDASSPQAEKEVRQLISLHETLIEQQSVTQSQKKASEHEVCAESHASPMLKNTESSTKPVKMEASKRSMEEQVLSCIKKKPIVNVAKLKLMGAQPMAVDSPQKPITLTFDASDDEEDIADSIDEEENGAPQTANNKVALPHTPVGTATNTICPPRRSLNLQLRLSLAESDLDNSITVSATNQVKADDEGQRPLMENEGEEAEAGDITTTTSQASSSVCSSSAATVVLESDYAATEESQDSQSEELEQATDASPQLVRRDVRQSKRRSVVSGLAAKRLSQMEKLSMKRQEADAKAYAKSIAASKSVEDNESSGSSAEESHEEQKKRGKIVKPVIKPPRKKIIQKLPASASTTRASLSGKRNRDAVESSGPFSPAPPKSKQMRCGSPLCHSKPKTKASATKRSRNTFLNRSTAASRARRTPGEASPAMASRSRLALLAPSSFKFTSQAVICLSPVSRPANLTAEFQSFIRRNTPQKVNYEEQLAAKKEQLELKKKREKEAKRRKEEEKQRKILEKKRKQEERERKAAEQRERREQEQKEKQQKQVEQWEKRVADADKVKIIRKKEETVKAKKLQKKQAEAEEIRRKEEEERVKKLKEQEQDKEQRLLEQKLLKEQEAAARRQAEHEKLLEKQRQEKLKEEKEAEEARQKAEEERLKREEEEQAKRKKAEDALKLKQQKIAKEEVERKRKLQEEVERRNAEAARIESERKEKEKEAQRKIREEAQRRQEEAIRRKEREEARKRKLEEAKAAADEKARKRKEEELARTEELRRKREEIRRQAEQRREEERAQREEEKRKYEEEKRKKLEEAKKEKLKQIQESNDKLRKLEEEHKKERDRLREMNPNSTMDKCLYRTPGPNTTFTMDANNTTHGSPQTYDITPQVMKKFAPSTEENYNIEDLASGDSTDDDEQPRKVVPKWAKGGNLRSQLIRQYYTPPDMATVFRDAMDTKGVRLDHIFSSFKARYFKRTSSAHWSSPIMPVGHISFTDQCRGFDHSTS